MSVNRVVLVGRLTRDPEIRESQAGKSLANFGIAVNKKFKREGEPDADFFNCTAFGKSAEFMGNYLGKGRLVSVDGRLQQRKYTTKDGQEREVIEIVADDVQALDRPQGERPGSSGTTVGGGDDEFDPFADE